MLRQPYKDSSNLANSGQPAKNVKLAGYVLMPKVNSVVPFGILIGHFDKLFDRSATGGT